MSDRWFEGYGGQSTDELLEFEGQYRADSLVVAIEDAILRKAEDDISTEESYVIAIEALEREVNNGGYSQFFYNSSGRFAPVIETALRAIGCPKTADITRDAIAALGVDGALTAEKVEQAALSEDDRVREGLSACDDRYFENDEPIADLLFAWIKVNRQSVRLGDA